MEFILASSNPHKAQEFDELLGQGIINIKAASEKIQVIEDGQSYYANAYLKAKAYYDKYKLPVMADDSGLNVVALPEKLGVQSARYGGEGLNDKDRAMLLLKEMESIDESQRQASFTCVLCFMIDPQQVFYFEGQMDGHIAKSYEGLHGFGYDPVFIPHKLGKEESVALHPEWKKEHCHRALACLHAVKFFTHWVETSQ